MIFPVAEPIAFLSTGTILPAGWATLSETPGSMGFTRKPPVYLMPGDAVEITAKGIGTLSNPVRSGEYARKLFSPHR